MLDHPIAEPIRPLRSLNIGIFLSCPTSNTNTNNRVLASQDASGLVTPHETSYAAPGHGTLLISYSIDQLPTPLLSQRTCVDRNCMARTYTSVSGVDGRRDRICILKCVVVKSNKLEYLSNVEGEVDGISMCGHSAKAPFG